MLDDIFVLTGVFAMAYVSLAAVVYSGSNRGRTRHYWRNQRRGIDHLFYPVHRLLLRPASDEYELRSERRYRVVSAVTFVALFASFVLLVAVSVTEGLTWTA